MFIHRKRERQKRNCNWLRIILLFFLYCFMSFCSLRPLFILFSIIKFNVFRLTLDASTLSSYNSCVCVCLFFFLFMGNLQCCISMLFFCVYVCNTNFFLSFSLAFCGFYSILFCFVYFILFSFPYVFLHFIFVFFFVFFFTFYFIVLL